MADEKLNQAVRAARDCRQIVRHLGEALARAECAEDIVTARTNLELALDELPELKRLLIEALTNLRPTRKGK